MVTKFVGGAAVILIALWATRSHANERPIFCGTESWRPLIMEAAARAGIPAQWLHAVIRAESAGCAVMSGRPTTSSAGAMGLMQLMPTTWSLMSRRLGLGNDPYQPRDNILAGAEYLRELYDRYGSPGFLAAYQAGPERYEEDLRGGRPLPLGTLDYVNRVLDAAGSMSAPLTMRPAGPTFHRGPFIVRDRQRANIGSTPDQPMPDDPFVDLAHTRQPPARYVGDQPDVHDR